ncbi:hypothetical protein PTKIN_Ptkin12aG0048900 [Pterospermum kingtungense]
MAKQKNAAHCSFVPLDIQREILSRLPVKSLLRFKCVQQSWYNLIEDHAFIAMHRNRFGKNNNGFLLYNCSKETLMSSKSYLGQPQGIIIGSSNGLVCLINNPVVEDEDGLKMHVWNPSTRKIMELPKCLCRQDDEARFYVYVFAFGFCSKVNGYKVVKVISSMPSPSVEVYTLGTKSWKKIVIPNGVFILWPSSQPNTFINGASHWLGGDINSPSKLLIVSFQFEEEVFLGMDLPTCNSNYASLLNLHITEYQNFLSVIVEVNVNNFEFWVMKEYGVADSWVRQFAIDLRFPLYKHRLLPMLHMEKNGELLFRETTNKRAVWYNIKTKQIVEQELPYSIWQVISCEETLV